MTGGRSEESGSAKSDMRKKVMSVHTCTKNVTEFHPLFAVPGLPG